MQQLALIVGGSSGIGLATAKQLLAAGTPVLLLGRNLAKLQTAQQLLAQQCDTPVHIAAVDLYDPQAVDGFIATIAAEPRHILYLVNAAGYFKPVSFIDHSAADYAAQMDINRSFFFITQAVAKNMQRHGGGSIVNIGSMWAHQAVKATPSSAYSMQKAGLHALTKNLAIELADDNIRVNAVAPAVVLSTIYKSFIAEAEISDALAGFAPFHPLGRIGTVEDIANAVFFLLSDKASWISGTIVNVDGGVMAGRN